MARIPIDTSDPELSSTQREELQKYIKDRTGPKFNTMAHRILTADPVVRDSLLEQMRIDPKASYDEATRAISAYEMKDPQRVKDMTKASEYDSQGQKRKDPWINAPPALPPYELKPDPTVTGFIKASKPSASESVLSKITKRKPNE